MRSIWPMITRDQAELLKSFKISVNGERDDSLVCTELMSDQNCKIYSRINISILLSSISILMKVDLLLILFTVQVDLLHTEGQCALQKWKMK